MSKRSWVSLMQERISQKPMMARKPTIMCFVFIILTDVYTLMVSAMTGIPHILYLDMLSMMTLYYLTLSALIIAKRPSAIG